MAEAFAATAVMFSLPAVAARLLERRSCVRARDALLGSVVADAAARPLHWVYKRDVVEAVLEKTSQLEFYPENKCPFYDIPLGASSPYFEQLYVSLKTLAGSGGKVDVAAQHRNVVAHFGPGTAYEKALEKRKSKYDENHRELWPGPVPGPWIQHATIDELKHIKEGKTPTGSTEVTHSDGLLTGLPYLLAHPETNIDDDELWHNFQTLVKTATNTALGEWTAEVAGRILLLAVQGCEEPVQHVQAWLKETNKYPEATKALDKVLSSTAVPHMDFTDDNDKSCNMPGNLMCSLHAFVTATSYVDGVRKAIAGGGCNCSRTSYLGALLAAKYGAQAIPREWIAKTDRAGEVRALAAQTVPSASACAIM